MARSTLAQPRNRIQGLTLALPAVIWLSLFFLLPLLFVLGTSFLTRGVGNVGVLPPTIEHYERTFTLFWPVIERSLGVALLTMVICLLIGYPVAYLISTRKNPFVRQIMLFTILLPFWTNFLVRTYALQTILGREGLINNTLLGLNLISEPLTLLNTPFAVMLGLVYGYLPFMILPIFASVERLDRRMIEAAYDLGANDWRVLWRVIIPLTWPGIIAGCTLVFIPAIGSFITPDLLGGTRGLMIGNLITGQFRGRGSIPLGSALSVVLMGIVTLGVFFYLRYGNQQERAS